MRRLHFAFGASLLASALLAQPALAANILIWDGGQSHPGTDNVVIRLQALGNTVTRVSTVPADLTPFDTLWAMDYLTGPDAANERAMVATFLNTDRGIYAQFEWDCCTASQTNWTATLSPLLKQPFAISGSQGVTADAIAEPNEVFGLTTTPNVLPVLQVNATANIVTIPAANVVYRLNGTPVVGAYVDPQFVSGDGCLVLSGDIEQVFAAPQANQWIQNAQYFLDHCIPNPQPICGDGFLAMNEACDDGNMASGDGCSSACAVEAGWQCTNDTGNTPVSSCSWVCPGQGSACSSGIGACEAAGTVVCVGPNTAQCNAMPGQPSNEVCDSVDNDCDGSADEDFTDLGMPCSVGVGACQATGQVVCNANGGTMCSAIPNEPNNEICDAIDNNCDGTTDEGFGVGDACSAGVGACLSMGVVVCDANGGSACNAVAGDPSAEVCDGVDNNCDGTTDEGFGLGMACTVGVGACEAVGVVVCDMAGTPVCGAMPGMSSAEACDGIDNDCDGTVDNGNPGGGMACNTGLQGVCADGLTACNQTMIECTVVTQPGTVTEVCGDELDNDCDGTVDNGCPVDSDGDGLLDDEEIQIGTDPNDADSDDDGILDGAEPEYAADSDGDGAINANDPDSDNDGLKDGTEVGNDCSNPATDPATGNCIPDADMGATTTDPLDADTDDGTVNDGVEDANHNGVVDQGETDPNVKEDDITTMPDCDEDSDCGDAKSGKVCDVAGGGVCVDGCHLMGNGCPEGFTCTAVADEIGQCVPVETPPPVVIEGSGLCNVSPGRANANSMAMFISAALGLSLALRRRRRG